MEKYEQSRNRLDRRIEKTKVSKKILNGELDSEVKLNIAATRSKFKTT